MAVGRESEEEFRREEILARLKTLSASSQRSPRRGAEDELLEAG